MSIELLHTLLLSRIQFAANMTFHIIYPSISIGTSWFLFYFRARYSCTKQQEWLDAYRFFVKIFALSFAIGVVSGITLIFQFGTNWPGYMEHVGNIAGPLLGYETLTAFFMEASFLGIMLFGMDRVSDKVHTISVFIVALGTTLSAFWILVQNSWMQTPSGYKIINGSAIVTSWFDVIFNPSMPYRLTHMLLAALVTSGFIILSLSAFRYLRQDRKKDVTIAIKTSLIAISIILPLQIIIGDTLGLNTLKYQPQKIAAIEGIWNTAKPESGERLKLFAIPLDSKHRNILEVSIPHLGSVILTHTWSGTIKGLNSFNPNDIPPVFPVFWSFRIMVGLGILMLLTSWGGTYLILKNKPITNKICWIFILMMPSGILATIFGWYVSEIGRQPFIIYNLFRVQDFVTHIPPHIVITSLILYLTTYVLVIISYFFTIFYMASHARESLTAKSIGRIS